MFVAVVTAPAVVGVSYSMLYSLGGIGLLSTGWTFLPWKAALTDAETWLSLGFSLYVAASGLLLSTMLALALVLVLGAHVRRGVLGYLLYVPLAMPPAVAGLAAVQVLGNTGLVSRIAYVLHLVRSPAEFPAVVFDRWGLGIILTHVALLTPFLVLLFDRLGQNERIDEFARLAQTLGAGRPRVSFGVVAPMLLLRAAPTLSMYFIFLVSAFDIPLLIGAQYPAMISVVVQRRSMLFELGTKPEAFALTSIYAILMVVALVILFRSRRSVDRSTEAPS